MKNNHSRNIPPEVKTTYAVYGMMDFSASVRIGNRIIPVDFTGGRISGYGVRPATFSTSDPIMKELVEALPDFRRGRIVRLGPRT